MGRKETSKGTSIALTPSLNLQAIRQLLIDEKIWRYDKFLSLWNHQRKVKDSICVNRRCSSIRNSDNV